MNRINRLNVNEENAYSEIVEAGDFVFLSFCVGNVEGTIEEQVHGALNNMEKYDPLSQGKYYLLFD